MDELQPFFRFINGFLAVSTEEFSACILPYIAVRRYEAKEMVLAIGAVEDYFNFLLAGLARSYYISNGQEVTTQLATPGHIIHAHESFHSRQPSAHAIDAIEPTLLASISYDDLERIYAGSAKMQHLGRLIITYTMLLKEKVQLHARTLSPRERFLHFAQKNPSLLQRVPQKFIASYLNIKPETLSRFKHLLREKKDSA